MNTTNILLQSKSWAEFTSEVRKLNQKGKGDCFEALTTFYLQLHPNYATKLEHIWRLPDVPVAVNKHLNLPGPDEGIDLIAQTKEGDYWAIQCKFRDDETKSLSRRELATFTDLTFGICKNFQLAVVCTTADRFSRKLGLYGERVSFICGDRWRELDEEFFRRLHALIHGNFTLPTPLNPRSHQLRAVQNAYSHFIENGNDRGKLIMPCGTGKSLAAYWIAEKLGSRSILIAVPSLALIRQTLEVWARESLANQKDIQWICVCSDTSVADVHDEDVAVLSQDLGVRIHTDPDEVAGWLTRVCNGFKVVITTYQSGKAVSAAASKAGFVFDLGILDEAHKTVGKRHSLFSHLLHDQNVKIKKRIFMTATERRYLGQSEQIASMEDPALYGDTFELLSFKAALEQNPPILCDYMIATIVVRRSEISELIQKNLFVRPDKGNWDEDVEAEMLATAIALRKAMLKHPIKHAISFHSSIVRARVFKDTQNVLTAGFPRFGELQTFHVSGTMPTSVRKREVDIFEEASRGLITNARCLTEGVDIPNIDCVLFADPRRSAIDVVQAVGRALRPSRGKGLGYVIIPILIDDNAGVDTLLEGRAFDTVLTTLRALAANDDRIIEYFRSVSQGRRHQRGKVPLSVDLPLGVEIDAEAFAESIELKLWSRLAKLSWRPFEEARAYVQTLGLKSFSEWMAFCRGELPHLGTRPEDIPSSPELTYEDKGWISLGDWLGTGTIATQLRRYRPFDEVKAFVHSLELKNVDQWNKYIKGQLAEKGTCPEDIPARPDSTYANKGWTSWGDWLGTGFVSYALRQYRPFVDARAFVHSLELENSDQWQKYVKGQLAEKGTCPEDIPANPNITYANKGWTNMGDWLGTGTIASHLRRYRPFQEARAYVRTLGLKRQQDWKAFCRGKLSHIGTLPSDIPGAPNTVYEDKGWIGWGDWLGTGKIAPSLRRYRSFQEARAYVQTLRLKSGEDWMAFCRGQLPHLGTLPVDIPSYPNKTYANKGWISMGDWLGTGFVSHTLRQYRPFVDARAYVQTLGLKSGQEWKAFCRGDLPHLGTLPADIPSYPNRPYRQKGWTSWGDWLGTNRVAYSKQRFRSFEEARQFVHGLGLRSSLEWQKYCQGLMPEKGICPADIPSNPDKTYRQTGWISMGDWLGTGRIANFRRRFRSFQEARAYVRTIGLKSGKDWMAFYRGKLPHLGTLPADIPANPKQTYATKGWISMGDWLGTGKIAPSLRRYRSFQEARAYVHGLGLRSYSEWGKYCKGLMPEKGIRPADIPADPLRTYATKGWISNGDWLGTGRIANRLRRYRSFQEARAYVQTLRLKSGEDWMAFCRGQLPHLGTLPADIPSYPSKTYANKGWISMGDWLGTGTIATSIRRYPSFEEARRFVHSLGLRSSKEWGKYCKGQMPGKGIRPADIPSSPQKTYANKGWISWGDWLGTGAIAAQLRIYRPFDEARAFIHSLELENVDQWQKYVKGQLAEKGTCPEDIPAHPDNTYANKGWTSFGDWLGTNRVANSKRRFRSFEEARRFVHGLGLRSSKEWGRYCKGLMPEKGTRPADIPSSPSLAYKDKGWISMGDWLGTGMIASRLRRYRPFQEAQ